jgi:MFS family permease
MRRWAFIYQMERLAFVRSGASRRRCAPWRVSMLTRGLSSAPSASARSWGASIAQLVLPELEPEFHASVGAVAWVSVAYLLVLAATLPIFGRLADMLGRKLLYCIGFLVFVTGSGLCGLAPTLEMLIGARVLQGLGAGLMSANSVAIAVTAAGDARRGRALGVQAAAQAVGLSARPLAAY